MTGDRPQRGERGGQVETRRPLPEFDTRGLEASLVTEAMIAAGAHVLSEWLDDQAPLNEARYREPAKAAFLAMMRAEFK